MANKAYIAIDLKSFYASAECRLLGMDPLTTNLVVADSSRTDKTICLAVTPSLKSYGVPGRPRLFEVIQKVRELNQMRRLDAPGGKFTGKSYNYEELQSNPALEIDYLVAKPQMAYYIQVSARIYEVYLKYIAPEDIHVYSIDEVFIDATPYLKTYNMTPRELTMTIIKDVLATTGITATAGIGTNLFLCKVAMDIVAKKMAPDKNGVRIAELDEESYRRTLWSHRPLTDFWRVGPGYTKKLEAHGLYTMGDIARCSVGKPSDFHNEALLYKLFGVNAELLIDHAWGWEPCTIEAIKKYKPRSRSLSSGQVLQEPYPCKEARLVTWEMADELSLDLVRKGLVTDQLVLTVGYDRANFNNGFVRENYKGEVKLDHYGRKVPKHARGTINLDKHTSSTKKITAAAVELFDRLVDPNLLVRRINIDANHVMREEEIASAPHYEQIDLFSDLGQVKEDEEREKEELQKEKNLQQTILGLKERFGKNVILKGANYEEGATAKERNQQIGGHKA